MNPQVSPIPAWVRPALIPVIATLYLTFILVHDHAARTWTLLALATLFVVLEWKTDWTFLKVLCFVLTVFSSIAWIGEIIPAERGQAVESSAARPVSRDATYEGAAIFNGPDSCSVCHALEPGIPNLRGPNDMRDVFVRAANRKPGVSAVSYLLESLYEPDAYVVKDPELGGPFEAGVMKSADRPPLSLSHDQVRAVAAFLISRSTPLNAALLAELDAAQAPYRAGRGAKPQATLRLSSDPAGDPEAPGRGRALFASLRCTACHPVTGAGFPPPDADVRGPELAGIGAVQTEAYLVESILSPSAVITAPQSAYAGPDGESLMPDFGDAMTARELADLVAYLKSLRSTP